MLLTLLILACALGLVHLMLATQIAFSQRGAEWALGPRDDLRMLTGLAARLERARANYMETFPIFAALVLAAQVFGATGALVAVGGWLWLAARIAYLPLYASGIRLWRTIVWGIALLSLIVLGLGVALG